MGVYNGEPTCEMNTLNRMQSIVMRFVHCTFMPKCHTHGTQIFSSTCERKTINSIHLNQ